MFAECAIQHMIFLIRHVTLGTDPLVLVSHLLLALFNTAGRAAPLLLVLGNKFFLGERVEALQLLQKTKSIEQSTEWIKRNMLEKKTLSWASLRGALQTLTRASTLSWCLCWKVAWSISPSWVGSRLMSSGWILSSRAFTSHSCLCLTLR